MSLLGNKKVQEITYGIASLVLIIISISALEEYILGIENRLTAAIFFGVFSFSIALLPPIVWGSVPNESFRTLIYIGLINMGLSLAILFIRLPFIIIFATYTFTIYFTFDVCKQDIARAKDFNDDLG